MIEATFQLGPGLGEARERTLWSAGILSWDDYDRSSVSLPGPVASALAAAVPAARCALAARDIAALAALLPSREHWRLFGAFGAEAAYLDIETGDDAVEFAGISAIGVLDRRGPRVLLADRDLEQFPELARDWSLLVTFNGGAFDVPILRDAFPDWQPPAAHIDLRHVLPRIGQRGKLKDVEAALRALHLTRPAHLESIRGWGAAALYQRGRSGDREALRRFVEYNLYDAIGLRTLMAHAHNRLLEPLRARFPGLSAVAQPVTVSERGDVLYDVSKILLTL